MFIADVFDGPRQRRSLRSAFCSPNARVEGLQLVTIDRALAGYRPDLTF
ncbi:hypothetical protein SAMN02927900_02422 [Rhizobium mongolense subsp. loessense]|uniref:Uncharacterized protein n=1 Tax=Rhizobium mongolense subsp. loessense TaxID=158890 RepID=A0A1G4RBD2_9HYPH|nr:hypothetical protein SAMN02927900_02422 [Rhizobium mongolense subsp. loessense]